MSNVKAGDIARIVHPRQYGKLVEVLFLIERQDQGLEGRILAESAIGHWMCRSLGSPFIQASMPLPVMHVPIADRWLRPIGNPGEDARDETLECLPVPATTPAPERAEA